MSEKNPSVGTYILVFMALLVLAALTTGIAYIDLGPFNTVIALAIAVVKMSLVGLFFMHLWYSPGLNRIVVLAGFFWLALMISFTLADVFTPPVDKYFRSLTKFPVLHFQIFFTGYC